jgi:hypothetical protein
MPSDASGDRENPQFATRLDAVFARLEAQIREDLRRAFARKRRGRPSDPLAVRQALSNHLHETEEDLALARDQLGKAGMAVADWERKAMLAIQENDYALARQALEKHGEYLEAVTQLTAHEALLAETAAGLRRVLDTLETAGG